MATTPTYKGPLVTGSDRYSLFALGAFIPLLIGVYWPLYWLHPRVTPLVFRPAVLLCSLVMALFGIHRPLSRMETRLAGYLALFAALWFGTALTATDVGRALEGWIKLVALCLVAILISRALRSPSVTKGFGFGMLAASMIAAVFILFAYVRLIGLSVPTFAIARQFKGVALDAGISLNAIAFTPLVAYICGMCIVRANWFSWSLGAALLIICSAFTGSRAPIAVLILTGIVLLIANGISSRRAVSRLAAVLACGAILTSAVVVTQTVSFYKMSEVTEGRWDLWYIALQKFSERPLVGYGFESINDDLYAREPGVYKLERRKDHKFPGGFHNEFIGTLAEEGLIGFIPVVAIFGFLLRSCWLLAFRKWGTWSNGQWALTGALFLAIRGTIEVPGLFGYANGPPDFLAYLFLALVVSRFSIEENYARAAATQIHSVAFRLDAEPELAHASARVS